MFTKLKDFKSIRKSMHLFSNDEGEELPGKQGRHLKSPASLPNQKSKGKQSDAESENRTEEEAAGGQDGTWMEYPQKYQPSTQHPQHHEVVTSSSEASVPLSSSTQVSPQSSARQSPLRRSFKSLKQAIRRSPLRHSESPSPPQESDFLFEPPLQPRKEPLNVKQTPGAPTSLSTDPIAPLPTNPQAQSAQPSPKQVTREVTAGQEARQMPDLRQQGAGQKQVSGQGNKKRLPPGAGFNPSRHRHTWPCEMIPINVPSPEVAQTILHPRKDVFVLKVAKVTANGDRRVKMELELVTPKYGKKLPSRLDTREAQCDPECCCPCACCPKPRKKKK